MKLVVATPLYPPDIGDPAPYVKELASRLVNNNHQISIVAYGRLPEPVPGASLSMVDKRTFTPLRVVRFFFTLLRTLKGADVLYIQSGISVELPTLIALMFAHPHHILYRQSAEPKKRNLLYRNIQRHIKTRAITIESPLSLVRPEILPLEPFPQNDFAIYEQAWTEHIAQLEHL